jgi:hypothetical protein
VKTKPKSLRSYAERYGVSHELIRRIKSEGLDLEDETAVQNRISENVKGGSLPHAKLTVPRRITGSGLTAAIQRLQAAEIAAHEDYLDALENAPEAAGRALKAWQTILDQLRKAEIENPTIQKENAQTVTREELAETLGILFRNLRTDLEALPRKIGLVAGKDAEKAANEEVQIICDSLYSCKYL